MQKDTPNRIMKCPACGSHHTQTLPMFYSSSARYFRGSDREGMAKQLEPPRRKSEKLVPILAAGLVWILTLLALADGYISEFAALMPIGWLTDPKGLIALAIASLVLLTLWYRADAYNRGAFRRNSIVWWNSAICKRCATTFSTESGEEVDIAGKGQ